MKSKQSNITKDRDPCTGRWAKGNTASVTGKTRSFNQAFQDTLTDKDFTCILKKVIKAALGNNLKAQLFLLKMCLPRLYEIKMEEDQKVLNPQQQRNVFEERFGQNYHQRMEHMIKERGLQ